MRELFDPHDFRPTDRRDLSAPALSVLQGCLRFFKTLGTGVLSEFDVGNGRRADLIAMNAKGLFTIVEIKSGLADYRSDQKWPHYLEYADFFYFAVEKDFPLEVLDQRLMKSGRIGVIYADRHGAEIINSATLFNLHSARRKALTQRFALAAGRRLLSQSLRGERR